MIAAVAVIVGVLAAAPMVVVAVVAVVLMVEATVGDSTALSSLSLSLFHSTLCCRLSLWTGKPVNLLILRPAYIHMYACR